MSIYDGAAYRQPHACSTRLCGVEGVEDSIEMRWIDARPGIADGHEGTCMVLLGADHQLSCPLLYRAHCFSRVENQVQQDLLQLNAIPQNRKQSIRKPGLDRNAIPLGDALRQYEHFVDRRIEIKAFLSRWRFLDVITHSSDDVPSSVRVPDNTIERFPGLIQIRRIHFQKPHPRTSVVAGGRDRMQNFVRQRSSEFSHHAYAVYVGEIRLHLFQSRQRSCAILNVRQENIPARDAPRVIANWDAAVVKPAIFPVEASQPLFEMIWNPRGDRFCEHLDDMGKIVRMYRSVCCPIPQLLQRLSAILEDLAIDGFELTIRGQDRNLTRYPVNCRARPSLAFTQGLLAAGDLQDNGSLGSEICDQFDLFLRKGLYAPPPKTKRSDLLVVSEHRQDEDRPNATRYSLSFSFFCRI